MTKSCLKPPVKITVWKKLLAKSYDIFEIKFCKQIWRKVFRLSYIYLRKNKTMHLIENKNTLLFSNVT